jgi:hypothetical protein
MASYPGSIPSLTRPAHGDPGDDGSSTDATVVVGRISDEIEAIAAELGTSPSAAFATVAARLADIETNVSGKASTASVAAKADDNAVVKLSTDQTVAGVKTFTSPPAVPAPVAGGDAANKTYVDAAAAAGVSYGGSASTQAVGDSQSPGVAATASRSDHKHGLPAFGTTAGTIAQGNDARFTDARTPTAHATSHKSGGSDAIRLDELAVPTASVALNSQKITGLATPTASGDAATKGYTDTQDGGQAVFGISGAVTVRTGAFRVYNDSGRTRTIRAVRASAGTAPTGATLIVDVNKGGTTIFGTQANRPTIAISGNTNKTTGMTVTTWADGEYLTVDVDQIGSTVAGSDLTVVVEWA